MRTWINSWTKLRRINFLHNSITRGRRVGWLLVQPAGFITLWHSGGSFSGVRLSVSCFTIFAFSLLQIEIFDALCSLCFLEFIQGKKESYMCPKFVVLGYCRKTNYSQRSFIRQLTKKIKWFSRMIWRLMSVRFLKCVLLTKPHFYWPDRHSKEAHKDENR